MKRRLISLALAVMWFAAITFADDRPNIVWITSEDTSPLLGCYGDKIARTPHLDAFAAEGFLYSNCFSNAAVCAPARQTLITGLYATSIGGQPMRSKAEYPEGVEFFPKYLKEAGYYTTNNSKTDYNGGPKDAKQAMKDAWDESNDNAHWRNRPNTKMPFFSVFNIKDTHESRLFPGRWKKRDLVTDPAKVSLAAYLPDIPEVRLDIARYYDCIETMDKKVGEILMELDKDDLVDNTIVFFFSDHGGSWPRGKSFTYDSGTRVPLLIRIPEKWHSFRPEKIGSTIDQLVSFVDFAPTMLSLADIDIPDYMQGQHFLGTETPDPAEFVYTFRGRRGERYDIVRGVRSKEYLYLRNYTPHLPVMQHNNYSFGIPSYSAWQLAAEKDDANEVHSQWFKPKASEELYKISSDPDNVTNLAVVPEHQSVLQQYRDVNQAHIRNIRDSVFYAEGLTNRKYNQYQTDESYPLDELIPLGVAVSDRKIENIPTFEAAMKHENACMRYWGVMGCIVLGDAADSAKDALIKRLGDEEPVIQLQAARALLGIGEKEVALPIIKKYLQETPNEFVTLRAALTVDECGLLPEAPELKKMVEQAQGEYVGRIVEKLSK